MHTSTSEDTNAGSGATTVEDRDLELHAARSSKGSSNGNHGW